MKIKAILFILFVFCLSSLYAKEKSMQKVIKESMKVVEKQSLMFAQKLSAGDESWVKSFNAQEEYNTSDSLWWCSGFYSGLLWYVYDFHRSNSNLEWAKLFTQRMEQAKRTTSSSDIGFILSCSFGNGYRLTKNPRYEEVLTTGAKSLSSRYRSRCGCIQSLDSSDFKKELGWQIPVTINDMMNLELLLWASNQMRNQSYFNMAVTHANATIKNHFRADNSLFEVVSFDSITGKATKKGVISGFSEGSAWARGQAWGLYGFITMYSYTGNRQYLEQAKKIATYILFHPNFPADKIPFWDFNAPNIPNAARDVSAAAIMASALIRLSEMIDDPLRSQCIAVAETQLRTLSSPEYLAKPGTNRNFILKNSVGVLSTSTEIDVPLNYTDYYYVEALVRYNEYLKNKK